MKGALNELKSDRMLSFARSRTRLQALVDLSRRYVQTPAQLARIPPEIYGPGELSPDSPYYSTLENPLYMNRSPNDPQIYAQPRFTEHGDRFEGAADYVAETMRQEEESDVWRWRLFWYILLPAGICQAVWMYKNDIYHRQHFRRPIHINVPILTIRIPPKLPWRDGNRIPFQDPYHRTLPDGYILPDPNRWNNRMVSEDPPRWA